MAMAWDIAIGDQVVLGSNPSAATSLRNFGNSVYPALPLPVGGSKPWTFSETVDISGLSADNRDFTVCIIRCVYRAELKFGR